MALKVIITKKKSLIHSRFFILLFVSVCFLTILQAQQTINKPAPVNGQMVRFDTLINSYRYNKPDSALILINQGLGIAKKNNDPTGRAMMLNQLGMLNDNQGKYAEARSNYTEAFNLYRSMGFYKGMATETYRMGVNEARTGKYGNAIAKHLTALSYSEKIKDRHGIIEANLGLTDSYIPQHDYITALRYLQRADSSNNLGKFQNLTLTICNAYGVIYRETGRYLLAKKYVLQGLELSNSPKFNGLRITLLNTLATIYLKEGDIKQAIVMQKQALDKSHRINNFLREMESLFNLANSYQSTDTKQSLIYLKQAKKLAIEKGVSNQQINASEKMAVIYEQLGNYKEALALRKDLFKLADKAYYKKMAQQITSLQAGYELTKSRSKVKELELINKRDERDRDIIIGVVIGIMIVLLFIGLLYSKLRAANSGLAETNTVKDKLLSVMAHDLRSPFNSIINLLNLIKVDGLEQHEQKELFAKLELTSTASLETLDSILKWGQMQIKGLQTNPVDFEIKPIIDQAIILSAEAAEKKNIEVRNLAEGGIAVFADIEQVRFVIRNLFSNAIKFTAPYGKVHILVTPNIDAKIVTITMLDNGLGISPERLTTIFNLNNVSTSGTFNEKGTSMGLLLCKEFVEANKGTIHVTSKVGEGSEFYFTLPMEG